jgi:hypothetical protein
MQHLQSISPAELQTRLTHGMVPKEYGQSDPRAKGHHRDGQFVTLLNAFRPSGGLVRTPEIAARIANQDPRSLGARSFSTSATVTIGCTKPSWCW